MEKTFLDEDTVGLCKTFLSHKDMISIADESGYSQSTVLDIAHRRKKVNEGTKVVAKYIDQALKTKMESMQSLIRKELPKIRKRCK